jgi:hypothetical protein
MVTLNGHKDSIKFLENKIKRQLISLNYNLQINLKNKHITYLIVIERKNNLKYLRMGK